MRLKYKILRIGEFFNVNVYKKKTCIKILNILTFYNLFDTSFAFSLPFAILEPN